MVHEIYIIEDKRDITEQLDIYFRVSKNIVIKQIKAEELADHLVDTPILFFINEDGLDNNNTLELCRLIRDSDENVSSPIFVLTSDNSFEHEKRLLKNDIELCIKKPVDYESLYYIMVNTVNLIALNRGISPLTKLPGNIPIQSEIKKRFLKKQDFAVLYFDLDNFKAYNDTYGFLGGDEVIKQTAKIIVKNISHSENPNNFVGHIGGDDFVALVDNTDYEDICQRIILEFDAKILDYFSPEDLERGYIEVPNRKGIIEEFPLISLSIGIVEVTQGRFRNVLEIGEIGAQVKHLAKTTPGSAYAINRRLNIQ